MSKTGENLASDYATYFKIDMKSELEPVVDTVEDMLTRLEEFENLIEMVCSDGSQSLENQLPDLCTQKKELQLIFQRIDKLENFVNKVSRDCDILEKHVENLEASIGNNEGVLKNIFKPIFFKSNEAATSRPSIVSQADLPEVFQTSLYFAPEKEENS